VQAIDTDLNRSSQVRLKREVIQEDRPRFLGRVDSVDETFARICREEYARSCRHGCQTIEKLGGWDVHYLLDGSQAAVLAAIEVQAPRAPAAESRKTGAIAEVANVLESPVSVSHHGIPRGDGTYYCKDVGIILGDPENAVGTFELVHKLGGVSSWVDLPDLGHIDQSGQNLAVGPDR